MQVGAADTKKVVAREDLAPLQDGADAAAHVDDAGAAEGARIEDAAEDQRARQKHIAAIGEVEAEVAALAIGEHAEAEAGVEARHFALGKAKREIGIADDG